MAELVVREYPQAVDFAECETIFERLANTRLQREGVMMNFDRVEYGKIYHQLFGKASREDCRAGWRRWQAVRVANHGAIILHPHGTLEPAPHVNDYRIFATAGPLQFLARISEAFVTQLPEMFVRFSQDKDGARALAACGQNPRARARGFVHDSLVEGFVVHPVIGPAMAGAIAWLLSTVEGQSIRLTDYHLFGYEISYVPGPPGQKAMFNFRAVFNREPGQTDGMLDQIRAMPLPEWRPPPH